MLIPILAVLAIWSISFFWNNDGVRYNDPQYTAIPTLFILFPAMVSFLIAFKCKYGTKVWSYILYGLGLVVLYTAFILYMSTSGGHKDTSHHIAIGFAVMLLLFLIGFDIQKNEVKEVNGNNTRKSIESSKDSKTIL